MVLILILLIINLSVVVLIMIEAWPTVIVKRHVDSLAIDVEERLTIRNMDVDDHVLFS